MANFLGWIASFDYDLRLAAAAVQVTNNIVEIPVDSVRSISVQPFALRPDPFLPLFFILSTLYESAWNYVSRHGRIPFKKRPPSKRQAKIPPRPSRGHLDRGIRCGSPRAEV
jgi:hypothetical protein